MFRFLVLCSLTLVFFYGAVSPAAAHGYVTIPPSRQARCRLGEIPGCGDVQYEPQSVEAPQGSYLCNGNGARFRQLNDDALFSDRVFTVTAGIQEIGFTWTLTAPHRTTTWEYIVITADNTLLTSFDSHNTTPPFIVEHIVPLGGFTGRQTVLARWNIGDTINAFYSCVDLDIKSGSTQTAVAGAVATPMPIQLPIGLPRTDFAILLNETIGNTESQTVPLPYLYVVPGASV